MNNDQKADISDIERLVKASQAKDRSAFDELVRLYQRRAMHLAARILGDADEASEAVQTSFVKAYLGISKLKAPKRFEIWLLRIVANAATSQLRAVKRRTEKTKITSYYKGKKTLSPVERKSTDELKEAIKRAMLKLPKKEAQAISLFGLDSLSHKEAAEIMGCSIEAVRWYVFKARQKLKVLLKEYLE